MMSRLTQVALAAALLSGTAAGCPASHASETGLPQWEQLSESQRATLIAPVRERWNAEPGQREAMLERARRWQQMTPDERQHARRGVKRWSHMSDEQREEARALYHHMRTLEPDAREAMKAKWRGMDAAEREAWVEAHPAPHRSRERGD